MSTGAEAMADFAGRDVVVGRIGRAHGVRGEVSVELRTDEPERRFVIGTELTTEDPTSAPQRADRPEVLTVEATRWHQSRLLVTFGEISSRTQAEAANGLLLHALIDPDETPADPEEYYDHQLVGACVETIDGRKVGELVHVVHGAAQDLLSISAPDGRVILVPFVAALVPEVDVAGKRLVVADQPGLLSPAVPEEGA